VCKFIKENSSKTMVSTKNINQNMNYHYLLYRIFIYLNIKLTNTMKLSTTENIPGVMITDSLGIARGSTVRTRNVGKDIMAAFKNLIGGEVTEYTRLQADAREEALQRMISDAKSLGADAIVCVRFQTSVMMAGASELLAYGTAVKTK
jgi:uncharacterized protein YbjQ (UPF0145 family)